MILSIAFMFGAMLLGMYALDIIEYNGPDERLVPLVAFAGALSDEPLFLHGPFADADTGKMIVNL